MMLSKQRRLELNYLARQAEIAKKKLSPRPLPRAKQLVTGNLQVERLSEKKRRRLERRVARYEAAVIAAKEAQDKADIAYRLRAIKRQLEGDR